jgi:hypothetical protein
MNETSRLPPAMRLNRPSAINGSALAASGQFREPDFPLTEIQNSSLCMDPKYVTGAVLFLTVSCPLPK